MGAIVFHREKGGLNTPAKMNVSYQHNVRKGYCENVDKTKSDQNKLLIDRGMTYYKYYNERMREDYKPNIHPTTGKPYAIKSNAVKMLDLRISVNKNEESVNPLFDINEFCERAKKFCIDKFGEKNIAGMVYHADESSPHIHIQVIPLTPEGKLDSHYFLSPKQLSDYQTELAESMRDLGIVRGREKAVVDNRSIKQYYGNIKESLTSNLPQPNPGEDVKDYKLRADAVFTQMKSQNNDKLEKSNAKNRNLQTEIKQLEAKVKELETELDGSDLVLLKKEIERLEKELENAKSVSNQWADVARAVQHHLLPVEDEKDLGRLVRAASAAGKEYRIAQENDKEIKLNQQKEQI